MNRAVLTLLLITTACSGEPPETAETGTDQPRAEPAVRTDPTADSGTVPVEHAGTTRPGPRPPETKREQIQIEGTNEEIILRLVEPPPGFEPYFYTYVPENLTSEEVGSGGGTGWRFNARFAGVENPEAFVLVFFYPPNATAESVRSTFDALLKGRTRVGSEAGARRYAWSEQEYSYRGNTQRGQPLVGSAALGQREGRYFHVNVEYPAEYGDGFGPRAHRILSEWRWADRTSLAR